MAAARSGAAAVKTAAAAVQVLGFSGSDRNLAM